MLEKCTLKLHSVSDAYKILVRIEHKRTSVYLCMYIEFGVAIFGISEVDALLKKVRNKRLIEKTMDVDKRIFA